MITSDLVRPRTTRGVETTQEICMVSDALHTVQATMTDVARSTRRIEIITRILGF